MLKSNTAFSGVFILLSTYNGSLYLARLLDSLRAQTESNWRLLVRDDGSTDSTISIVRLAANVDSRIEILTDNLGRLGVTRSFEALMTEALSRGADFFALCDQDDVWLPEKLATLSTALLDGPCAAQPALAFSDLVVTDAKLNVLNPSFFALSHAGDAWVNPGKWLLLQNLVPGCAMVGNQELLRRCLPMPSTAVIHDWWVLLCAASMGRVISVPEPLILYRQHGANTIGAESYLRKASRFLLNGWVICRQKQQLFLASMQQNMALAQRLGSDQPSEYAWQKEIERLPSGLLSPSRWRRVRALMFGEVRRVGWARNLLLLCVLLTLRARQVIAVVVSGRGPDRV